MRATFDYCTGIIILFLESIHQIFNPTRNSEEHANRSEFGEGPQQENHPYKIPRLGR